MFIQVANAIGWQVVFEDEKKFPPLAVCCWGIREISGKHKVVPVVCGDGGKMVDANSIGKIAEIVQTYPHPHEG